MKRDSKVHEIRAIVGALPNPLGAPWALAIVEADASSHGGLESNRSDGFSIDVVADDGVFQIVLGRSDPEVTHDTGQRITGEGPRKHIKLVDRQNAAADASPERANILGRPQWFAMTKT